MVDYLLGNRSVPIVWSSRWDSTAGVEQVMQFLVQELDCNINMVAVTAAWGWILS